MATQSSNVLKMLQEISAKEVDMATEALANAMKVASEAKAKQDMLLEYRQDYVKNLNKILEEGMGADCSSLPELMLAQSVGLKGEEIMFSSNNTPASEYKKAFTAIALKLIEVETLEQEDYEKILVAHGILLKKKEVIVSAVEV